MAKENAKSFMIVERLLCPPTPPYKRESVYCGKEMELTEIPKKLSLDSKVAGKYLYTVSKLEAKNNKLFVSQGCFNYEELRTGIMSEAYRPFKLSEPLELPLEIQIMDGILGLLSE